MHDYVLLLFGAVMCLTILSGSGAMVMAWRLKSSTPFAERLFDTLLWIASAGFFAILGLLAAVGHG
jgi:hypothetical protein